MPGVRPAEVVRWTLRNLEAVPRTHSRRGAPSEAHRERIDENCTITVGLVTDGGFDRGLRDHDAGSYDSRGGSWALGRAGGGRTRRGSITRERADGARARWRREPERPGRSRRGWGCAQSGRSGVTARR